MEQIFKFEHISNGTDFKWNRFRIWTISKVNSFEFEQFQKWTVSNLNIFKFETATANERENSVRMNSSIKTYKQIGLAHQDPASASAR
jgi:hypothetical protein